MKANGYAVCKTDVYAFIHAGSAKSMQTAPYAFSTTQFHILCL